MIYDSTMERTNRYERSPNSGLGRNPRFFASSMGGAAATSDCEGSVKSGLCSSEITGAGVVSPATGVDVAEVLTRTENGARTVVSTETPLKLKGREESKYVWENILN